MELISTDLSAFYNKQWLKAVRKKLQQKFSSFMQNKRSYTI